MPGSTGVRTSAQEAWSLRKGVCQDIAHLTVGMLRAVGIPARYVSGYLYPSRTGRSATPWPASRTPGSSGGAATGTASTPPTASPAGQRHVIVARGRDYADVTPLKGVYHGAASTGLGVTVEITRLA